MSCSGERNEDHFCLCICECENKASDAEGFCRGCCEQKGGGCEEHEL